ncbi:MAG TPA: FAD-dependent oxidoreductase [Candidatus Anoxymicrobiaceae bacterium]
MSEQYDVVVVGAGCAGALAGERIARGGHRVLLVDRRRPEELGHESRDMVEEEALSLTGMDPAALTGGSSRVTGLEVISPDTATTVRLSEIPFRIVDRRLLAAALMAKAREAGVQVLTQCIVGGVEVDRGRVTGITTDRGSYSARLTVGASGLDRVLCRDLPSGMGIPRRLRTSDFISVYRETRSVSPEASRDLATGSYRYHVGLYGGYSWTYASADGTLDIGTGVQDLQGYPDPREIVLGYVRSHPEVGEKVISREGGRIPTRRPLSTMVTNGMLVVGDAACQAAPVVARGVGGAVVGGILAAETALAALEADDVGVEALWRYNHAYMLNRGAHMAALDCLRLLMQRMTEKEFSWGMSKGVVDEAEISSALTGRFAVPNAMTKLKNFFKGLGGVPLLVRYENSLRNAQKVLDHYLSYPPKYYKPDFADWSQQADFLFEDAERV